MSSAKLDVAVIGGGAAGLATAIFAGRAAAPARIAVFDGARSPGAKILVSGGSRCNVTNAVVTETDFNGGRPAIIRRVLGALPVPATVQFFRDLGVPLHEEAGGKLFPDTNRSRDVLDALLRGVAHAGATLSPSHRVEAIAARVDGGFDLTTSQGAFRARIVVLATGGLALPKTGSDGGGYRLAEALGHTLVPTTPALAPIVLARGKDDSDGVHHALSGVAHPARLTLWIDDAARRQIDGSLLWTHFGISGPSALDMSRHWLRARLEGQTARLSARLAAGTFESIEAAWQQSARTTPRASVAAAIARMVPASVGAAVMQHENLPATRLFAELTRVERRALAHALTNWPLAVVDSRGYTYAEATAGGVSLLEVNPATMESRRRSGLYLVGEVLDVDGRLGGFNFQWAWSSARVAGDAIAKALSA